MSSPDRRPASQAPARADTATAAPTWESRSEAPGGVERPGRRRRFSAPQDQGPLKDALLRRLLATADVTAVIGAGAAVGVVMGNGLATGLYWIALLPVWVVVAKLHGLYDADRVRVRQLSSDELPALFHWATVSTAGVALLLALGPSMSAAGALAGWAVALLGALVLRFLARAAWRLLVPPERGVVIGEGQLADALARKLALEPGHHLALVASIVPGGASSDAPPLREPRPADGPGGGPLAIRTPGTLPELEDTIRREKAERVVLAMPDLDENTLARVVATCRAARVKLSVAPPLRAMLGTAVTLSHLAELPLIEFNTWDPSRSTALLKRVMDLALAGAGLIVLAPVLALVALLVKLDSSGPVIFRQWRAGQGGVPFELFKFRTMVRDAEERLGEVVKLEELREPMYKLREDPRVTRVGRVLRRTSMDELPQLFNVLRGEMSLVGPRPEDLRLVERYSPELRFRLEMRPGVTGPMQVHGRGELAFQERMAVEREYIENYSLRKDLKLLLRTAAVVLRRRGAF